MGPNSFMFSLPLLIPPLILPQILQSTFLLYFSPLDIPHLTPTSAMQSKSNQFSQRHRSTSAHQCTTEKKPHLYIQWGVFSQIPRSSKSCTNKRRTFQFVGSQNFVLTLLQAEPTLIAARCQYIHQHPDVITVRIFTVFSVLTEPAELLLPRTVGVVMVTCRQLKNRNVDRQIWTFLCSNSPLLKQ